MAPQDRGVLVQEHPPSRPNGSHEQPDLQIEMFVLDRGSASQAAYPAVS